MGAEALHVVDKGLRQPVERVGRRVDKEVWKFDGQGCQFVEPWKSHMPADHNELGKVEKHIFEIGDEAAVLGALERAGVPNLRAKGHPQFNARGIYRVVPSVVGWKIPEPGNEPHANEALTVNPSADLTYGAHRVTQIGASEPTKTRGRGGQ